MDFWLKIVFSSMKYSASMMLAMSLFRINLVDASRIRGIGAVAVGMAFATHLTYASEQIDVLFIMITLNVQLSLLVFFCGYSFTFSTMIAIFSFLFSGTIESTTLAICSTLGLNGTGKIHELGYFLLNLSLSTLFMLLATWFVSAKKLGFVYIHDPRKGFAAYRYWMACLLGGGVLAVQWIYLTVQEGGLQPYPILLLVIFLLVSLTLSYQNNKKIMLRETHKDQGRVAERTK